MSFYGVTFAVFCLFVCLTGSHIQSWLVSNSEIHLCLSLLCWDKGVCHHRHSYNLFEGLGFEGHSQLHGGAYLNPQPLGSRGRRITQG